MTTSRKDPNADARRAVRHALEEIGSVSRYLYAIADLAPTSCGGFKLRPKVYKSEYEAEQKARKARTDGASCFVLAVHDPELEDASPKRSNVER
jgi:hypothetical protein